MGKMAKEPKTSKSAPLGRPTKYEPRFSQMLVEHMASGFSYESFAGLIGTFRATLYNWEKDHSDFLDAKKEGSEKNLLFWEKAGHEGLWADKEGRTFNSTVWIFSMKNRHKWKDRQEVEIEKPTEDPVREELKNRTTEELLEIMKAKKE